MFPENGSLSYMCTHGLMVSLKECTLSYVKIQNITNMLTLGQIKLYIGPVNKNPKKKIQNFNLWKCKIRLLKKLIASAEKKLNFFEYAFMYTKWSGWMSRFQNWGVVESLYEIIFYNIKFYSLDNLTGGGGLGYQYIPPPPLTGKKV